ncbi:hypothetical protein NL108_015032 [Boleophthalmus pectinirostris]|nr:hypothetical protein NL108_015032 [Boleophthalmus pectinirostris]
MVEKKKKQRGQLEKQIAIKQTKVLCLENRLVELKSALAQQEEINKSLKTKQEVAKVEEKTASAPRRGKPKPKTQDSTNPSKPPRRANRKKIEPAAAAQKIKPDAPTREGSGPAPPDQALPLPESRAKRRAVAVDPGDNRQKRDKQPGARPDEGPPAGPTRTRRKAPPSTPAEEQALGLRRSKRIACRT